MLDKGFISRIYTKLLHLDNNPVTKRTKDLNRRVSKEDRQIANKQVKGHSTSPVAREMGIKTRTREHFTSITMARTPNPREQVLGRLWRNWNPRALLAGM